MTHHDGLDGSAVAWLCACEQERLEQCVAKVGRPARRPG